MDAVQRYRLELFGPFRLCAPDGAPIDVPSRKARAMVALLAMSRGGTRSRVWLQAMLWGSREPEQAQASLRREISTFRSLSPPHGGALLRAEYDRVTLVLELISVDAHQESGAPADWLSRGEFLEGLDLAGEEEFEDWLRVQRTAFAALGRSSGEAPGDVAMEGAVGDPTGPIPPLPVKPSIAVLPFTNLHDDEDRDYIADGFLEEITISLSRYSSLFVIASGSSLTYRHDRRDRAVIARELGVRYLLEGSVRIAGSAVRVSVKLSDAIAREQVWAERFEDDLARVFELQDRVAGQVAQRIDSSIEREEMRRAMSRPVSSPNTYHLYWRANALFRNWDQPSLTEAIELAERIIEIEPQNAWAPALAGFCHGALVASGWTQDSFASRARALAHYERAMRLGGDDPQVLGFAAGTQTIVAGDIDAASRLIDRALFIHPGSASLLFWAGWVDIALGEAERGLERFEAALRLNPRSAVRPFSNTGVGMCQLALGRYEDAVVTLQEAVQQLPFYPATLAALCASLAHAGRQNEAHAIHRKIEALGGGAGVLAILRNARIRQLLAAGLELAASTTSDQAA